ncbi:MAG: MG2 domain-containing protein [Cystobacterineae bacterium]|nr:MG2 domain-containing protein [Cystobacterineae bacterium]
MEAPLAAIQKEMRAAKKRNDQMAWALAFQQGASFLHARGQYEAAVEWFSHEAWPQEDMPFVLTSISYFRTLSAYESMFHREIARREAMEDGEEKPIRLWSKEQITQVKNATLGKAWERRAQLKSADVTKLKGFSKDNFFGVGLRKDKSLRGALSLLWAGFLRSLGNGTAQEHNESGEVSQEDLVLLKTKGNPTHAKVHPLVRSAWVYEELQNWHRENGRTEEASEVLRFHLTSLNAVDLKQCYAALETQLPLVKGKPEWANVQAQLAHWLLRRDEPVQSHALLQECLKAGLPGPGTTWCKEQLGMLLRAELSVGSSLHNAPGKSVLNVQLRNVPTLYFRAYQVLDVPNTLTTIEKLWERHKATAVFTKNKWIRPLKTWSMSVPQKGDFRAQNLEIIPELPGKGAYWLLVSDKNTFSPQTAHLYPILLIQTELALVVRGMEDEVEVWVANALTGKPEAGVDVRTEETQLGQTDSEGKTVLKKAGRGSFRFWASRGEDMAVSRLRYPYRGIPHTEDKALVSLDRAIYRPGQSLSYKVVVLRPQGAHFSPVANQQMKVYLIDPNRRGLEAQSVKTNAFGSIAGELSIPENGLLGQWQLVVGPAGGKTIAGASLSVEEYKRPTFEARFLEKQAAMKLNAPVKLLGEAKYYFGQALTKGKVKWRVERAPYGLRWWWMPAPASQTLAQGESAVGADGRFEVEFIAKADASLQGDVAYLYKVEADVLDEGGETQKVSYSFHLGMRALSPIFQTQGAPLFMAGKNISLPVLNKDLSGMGQKGQGTWKLYALNPQTKRELGGNFSASPFSSNANSAFDWQGELRLWGEGKAEKQGEVYLNESGKGVVDLGKVPRGAFRVVFETRDAFGNPCQAEQELLVVDSRLGMPFSAWVQLEKEEVQVGEELKLFLGSKHASRAFYVELFRKDTRIAAQLVYAGDVIQEFKWRVQEADRGGLWLRVLSIGDFEAHELNKQVAVPWDNKELLLSFSRFRDQLRPGEKERFVLSVSHKGKPLGEGEAEVLALMYDRSLELLRGHFLPTVWGLYQQHSAWGLPSSISLHKRERLSGPVPELAMPEEEMPMGLARRSRGEGENKMAMLSQPSPSPMKPSSASAEPLRENFAETAFFLPFLTTDARGQVVMNFEVPDSLTSWNVMASAHNKLGQASPVLTRETKTVKELMVRPYVPRFLREGDEATLAVVVNNLSDQALSGELVLELFEPETNAPLNQRFGLLKPKQSFQVPAQGLVKLEFALKTPMRLGTVALKAVARAGAFSDGEQRLLPVLPSRMHLVQSRFVALQGQQEKELVFEDMAKADDSRVDERLTVGLDGQLLTGVLEALPYLASYPYECTEQTFNRFFSAGMMAFVFQQNPQLAHVAQQLSKKRSTPLARFDGEDANRKLALEETPFLMHAQGGETPEWMKAVNLLEAGVAKKQAAFALEKLRRAQNPDGGFPWFAGGRSSAYMSSYMVIGFARAKEFSIPIPDEMLKHAWTFLRQRLEGELQKCMQKGGCVEEVVLTNYAASLFDTSVTGISQEKKRELMAYAESKRKSLAPRMRILTALTLHHMKESRRAKEWLESWMKLSRETENEGRFWAPESMSWVWYNDTLENHAFTLHALTTLSPGDVRAKGLVQWLFLNKKLSHWRSTRTTAEVLYALVGYLKAQNLMAKTERLEVSVGPQKKAFVFEPSNIETGKQQWVFEGKEIQPQTMGRIRVAQKTDGFHFASATWHFSTQKLPEKGEGDLFAVSRAYFKRVVDGSHFKLIPLKEGEVLRLGDEVEVQLTLNAKAPAEYVHLRDVRAAGLEPRRVVSGWKWEMGYACYEEVRDSGQNYFFEHLPKGEFRFSYRLVASMAGTFRLGPAVVQSMYAPEFSAHSQGHVLNIIP